MAYRYFVVAPAARVNMTILSPGDAKPRTLTVDTKIERTGSTITLQQWYDRTMIKHGYSDKAAEYVRNDNGVMFLKLHTFSLTNDQWDILQGKVRSSKSLILDLRDNGGGSVDILKKMVGFFFDKEVKIFDEKRRKESKPLISKPSGNGFKGDITVLINEGSASASEVFARLVQLEKRGKVIGDKSMGAVMESQLHELNSGIGSMLLAGTSVTMADLVMSDGKSLEKVGVTPDETVLPTGADLAATRDPVLAYAAKLSGIEMTPEAAAKLFPYEWPK
jgi:C-terminal processing protease CtpA/Prc